MNRYKNHLIVAAVLIVLAVIGTIMNSRQASAQDGGPHVTIESPIPLPVNGSVNVTGIVGITGTPTVNVGSTVTTPIVDVNDPGKNPYEETLTVGSNSCFQDPFGGQDCNLFFTHVPTGKRLVLTHISGAFRAVPPGVIQHLIISGLSAGTSSIPTTPDGTEVVPGPQTANIFAANAEVLMFFGPGDGPILRWNVTTASSTPGTSGDTNQITLYGHYVNLP